VVLHSLDVMSAQPQSSLPVCLVPSLLELERRGLPTDATTFFEGASTSSHAGPAREVLRFAALAGLDGTGLAEALRAAGVSEACADFFATYWAAAQPSREFLALPAPRRLVDLDWNFGVSASSSEHAAMGVTFVQLRLHTQGSSGAEYVHMELTLARFYELLHELEQAKAMLELA